jgi:hypothetical protein
MVSEQLFFLVSWRIPIADDHELRVRAFPVPKNQGHKKQKTDPRATRPPLGAHKLALWTEPEL